MGPRGPLMAELLGSQKLGLMVLLNRAIRILRNWATWALYKQSYRLVTNSELCVTCGPSCMAPSKSELLVSCGQSYMAPSKSELRVSF